MAWSTHSTTEDFYITLRYAENIAHGAGFVYNHGERILGTTTPLYTLILALSAWLHMNPIIVGKLLNIAADGATCFLIAYLPARPEICYPRVGQFAALLYAFSSTPISITIGGMETGLVTCVCMAMITAYVARSTRPLYILGAVLFLLRIDGLVLFGLLAVCLAYQQRRLPWRDLGLAALIVAPWIVFATVYFGSPIPTSLTAKLYVYSHAMATPRAVTIAAFLTQFAGGVTQKALSILFVVGVMGILFKRLWESKAPAHPSVPSGQALTSPTLLVLGSLRAEERGCSGTGWGEEPLRSSVTTPTTGEEPLRPQVNSSLRAAFTAPVAWLGIYYLTMFSSRVPPFPWYFLPPWPLYLLIAALGGRIVLRWIHIDLPERLLAVRKQPAYAALIALGLYGTVHLSQIRIAIEKDQFVEDSLREPIGLWFNKHALPGERILLEPIGYVGYFSQRPILDMIGLVSPEVFRSYRTPHALADMVVRFHPDWLCIRPAEMQSIRRGDNSLLDTTYMYVREFHVPGRSPDFLVYHIQNR
jgi:hypothetical protein